METKNDVPLSGDTSSNVEGQVLDNQIDPIKERRVVRKLDLFITPVCFIVYLSCFIDRANIGMSHTQCCAWSEALRLADRLESTLNNLPRDHPRGPGPRAMDT